MIQHRADQQLGHTGPPHLRADPHRDDASRGSWPARSAGPGALAGWSGTVATSSRASRRARPGTRARPRSGNATRSVRSSSRLRVAANVRGVTRAVSRTSRTVAHRPGAPAGPRRRSSAWGPASRSRYWRATRSPGRDTGHMTVLVWVTEDSWMACVDAAQVRAPADEVALLHVTDAGAVDAAQGAFSALLGRGGAGPAQQLEAMAESAATEVLEAAAARLGRPAQQLRRRGRSSARCGGGGPGRGVARAGPSGRRSRSPEPGQGGPLVVDHAPCPVLLVWPGPAPQHPLPPPPHDPPPHDPPPGRASGPGRASPGRLRRAGSAVGVDPVRGQQDGDPSLLRHHPVVGVPIVVGPAGRGEHRGAAAAAGRPGRGRVERSSGPASSVWPSAVTHSQPARPSRPPRPSGIAAGAVLVDDDVGVAADRSASRRTPRHW